VKSSPCANGCKNIYIKGKKGTGEKGDGFIWDKAWELAKLIAGLDFCVGMKGGGMNRGELLSLKQVCPFFFREKGDREKGDGFI
jgi:hypothetical protein